jgi:hypothetical protein
MSMQEYRGNAMYCLLLSEFVTAPGAKTMLKATSALYGSAARGAAECGMQAVSASQPSIPRGMDSDGSDIDQLALSLMDLHGMQAPAEARRRAGTARARGDEGSHAVWSEVEAVINGVTRGAARRTRKRAG